jgi:hypothetical protein
MGILASTALVLIGSVLGGLDQHVTNLFVVWLCWTTMREMLRRNRYRWWIWPFAMVVFGAGAYGVVWTVGFERALLWTSGLIYLGMAGAVLFTELASRGLEARVRNSPAAGPAPR